MFFISLSEWVFTNVYSFAHEGYTFISSQLAIYIVMQCNIMTHVEIHKVNRYPVHGIWIVIDSGIHISLYSSCVPLFLLQLPSHTKRESRRKRKRLSSRRLLMADWSSQSPVMRKVQNRRHSQIESRLSGVF